MEHDRAYILHIVEAIEKIEQYVDGVSYDVFLKDSKTHDAVVRELEIIGEASNNLSEDVQTQRKDIPWRKIKNLRNKLIHEYFGIELELVWIIVERDIPALKAAVHKLLTDK